MVYTIITSNKQATKSEKLKTARQSSSKSHNLHTLTSVRTLKRKNDEKSRFREKSLRACEYLL